MSEEKHKYYPPTLCWDCARATGKCNWSNELKAVKGWKIIKTKRTIDGDKEYKSCIVLECPEFERDATGAGMKRYREEGSEKDVSSKDAKE